MITNELLLQAQAGIANAAETVLAEMERRVLASARKRAERMEGDAVENAKDMAQEARIAIFEAISLWDVTAENAAEFETFAFAHFSGAVKQLARAEAAPGISDDAVKRFMGALTVCDGDHAAATAYVTAPERGDKRLSVEMAADVRRALAGPARIDAGGKDAEDAMSAATAPLQDVWAEESEAATAPRTARLRLVVRDGEHVVAGARREGWVRGLQPSLCFNPVEFSRDAVRVKGARTTGGGTGKNKRGAIVDRVTEAQNRDFMREVAELSAPALMDKMSPLSREIAELAFGFNDAPMLLENGKLDRAAIAERLGRTPSTIHATWGRTAKKLRAA